MAMKKKSVRKVSKRKAPAPRSGGGPKSEEGRRNIARANRLRWRGYDNLTPAQKKKVLGGSRRPAKTR